MTTLRDSVSDFVCSAICNSIRDSVWYITRNYSKDTVSEYVHEHVYWGVRDFVYDSLWRAVNSNMHDAILDIKFNLQQPTINV
jgi:hypothetical protein